MFIHVFVHLSAVATVLFLQECLELLGKSGVREVTDTVRVHVTDVKTGMVLVVDTIIQKLFQLLLDVHIKFVLVEFTDVVLESVQDVADVLHM